MHVQMDCSVSVSMHSMLIAIKDIHEHDIFVFGCILSVHPYLTGACHAWRLSLWSSLWSCQWKCNDDSPVAYEETLPSAGSLARATMAPATPVGSSVWLLAGTATLKLVNLRFHCCGRGTTQSRTCMLPIPDGRDRQLWGQSHRRRPSVSFTSSGNEKGMYCSFLQP